MCSAVIYSVVAPEGGALETKQGYIFQRISNIEKQPTDTQGECT